MDWGRRAHAAAYFWTSRSMINPSIRVPTARTSAPMWGALRNATAPGLPPAVVSPRQSRVPTTGTHGNYEHSAATAAMRERAVHMVR
jgi:hypothetical protein